MDALTCLVVNETCSEECSGAKIGSKDCEVVEDEVCDVIAGAGEECRQVDEEVCDKTCDEQQADGQGGQQASEDGQQVGQALGQTDLDRQQLSDVQGLIKQKRFKMIESHLPNNLI